MSEQSIEVSEAPQIVNSNSVTLLESIEPSGLTRIKEDNSRGVSPSGADGSCGCGGTTTPPPLVYAIGQIGFDFVTEARRDSLLEQPDKEGFISPAELVANFENDPFKAASLIWTINLDNTPIYAIQPSGPFAAIGYERLREFLKAQQEGEVEQVSIPGVVSGKVTLINGHTIPVLYPEVRGMYSWSNVALVKSLVGELSEKEEEKEQQIKKIQAIINFLRRIYYETRSLGLSSQERAINHAITSAFQLSTIYSSAISLEMTLDKIEVEHNSICRPGTDCLDVKLVFFNPSNKFEQSRRIYRFTIDVSDIIPVVVGEVKDWYEDNGEISMSGSVEPAGLSTANTSSLNSVFPSGGTNCKCGTKAPPSLVYALGQIGYNFGTEARQDSFLQQTNGGNIYSPEVLLAHFEDNPSDAANVIWTLNSEGIPIYAIQPSGPFADFGYQRLREFLKTQGEEEQVSIPGVISGKVTLLNGYTLPIIQPEIRGMYAWSIATLTENAKNRAKEKFVTPEHKTTLDTVLGRIEEGLENFLARVYYEIRNLGLTSQERAINYAATRAFQLDNVYSSVISKELDLESIEVSPSPICRPKGDCWDVKLIFFNPAKRFEQARKMYRFTIDVSDVIPVKIGKIRSWTI